MRVLAIGLGGFLGAVLRYWMSGVAQSAAPNSTFPVGTLVVNLVGCLAIGIVSELVETRGFLAPNMRLFLVVGVLGGFTTFSAFANETVSALRDGAYPLALANVLASVSACILAAWLGRSIANHIWR